MRKLRKPLLAGGAVLLLAGAAVAATHHSHVLNVALPDGEIAEIHYSGNVAPEIVLAQPRTEAIAFADPFAAFDPTADYGMSPFAAMDRVAALMDQQAQAMMMRVGQLQREMRSGPPAMHLTGQSEAPAGVVEYSYVSTTSGNDGCTTSVSWRSDGSGAPPKVIKTSSGHCGAQSDQSTGKPLKAAAPKSDAPIPGAHRT